MAGEGVVRKKCPLQLALCRKNLNTQQSTDILDLCLKQTRAGKSRDYCDVIIFKKLRFQRIVFCPHLMEKPPFQIHPV